MISEGNRNLVLCLQKQNIIGKDTVLYTQLELEYSNKIEEQSKSVKTKVRVVKAIRLRV